MTITIPGMETKEIDYLVLDYNGTIAAGGSIIEGVAERIKILSEKVKIYILTADTYGSVHAQCRGMRAAVHVIGKEKQDEAKLDFIRSLGCERCIAIGNGFNDALMLKNASLGLAVMQEEGVCVKTMLSADIVYGNIIDALDAFIEMNRLVATLRN